MAPGLVLYRFFKKKVLCFMAFGRILLASDKTHVGSVNRHFIFWHTIAPAMVEAEKVERT